MTTIAGLAGGNDEAWQARNEQKPQHLASSSTFATKGKVTKSAEVASAAGILGSVLTLYSFGGLSWGQLRSMLADRLVDFSRPDLTDTDLMDLCADAAGSPSSRSWRRCWWRCRWSGSSPTSAQSGFMLSSKPLIAGPEPGQPDGRLQAAVLAADRRGAGQDDRQARGRRLAALPGLRRQLPDLPLALRRGPGGRARPVRGHGVLDGVHGGRRVPGPGAGRLRLPALGVPARRTDDEAGDQGRVQAVRGLAGDPSGDPPPPAPHRDVTDDAKRPNRRRGRHQSDPLRRCFEVPRRRDGRPEGDRQGRRT